MHWRVFSDMTLDAHGTLSTLDPKLSPDTAYCLLGTKSHLVENHFSEVTNGPDVNQASEHVAGPQEPQGIVNGQASARAGTLRELGLMALALEGLCGSRC